MHVLSRVEINGRFTSALDRTKVLVTVMVICIHEGLRYFVVKFGRVNFFWIA